MSAKNLAILSASAIAVAVALFLLSKFSSPPQPAEAVPPAAESKPEKPKVPGAMTMSTSQPVGGIASKQLTFWGRVVDQSGTPVKDAIVRCNFPVSTDQDGLFRVEGFDSLHIAILGIEKAGYYMPPLFTPESFWLSEKMKEGLDREHPFVLHVLRKEGDYEGLLRLERQFDLRSDGKPVTIDLLTARTSDAPDAKGDFRVTFTRPASVREKFSNYDWSATIEAVDGGFAPLSTDTNNSWWAPKEGYSASLHWAFKGSDPKWDAGALTKTFFRSRNGQVYGILTSLSLAATWSPVENGCPILALRGFLNPNSSRNLQNGDATVLNIFGTMAGVSGFKPGSAQRVFTGESAPKPPNVHLVPELPSGFRSLPAHDFYGKVVDENGNPIAGATIEIAVRSPRPGTEPTVFKATTDDKGTVKVPALPIGGSLPVRGPDKAGYLPDRTASPNLNFGLTGYGNTGMSPDSPNTWRLWKQKGPLQSVVDEIIVVECPPDGTPVSVDLLMDHPWSGIPFGRPKIAKGKSRDLQVSIARSSKDRYGVKEPWNFSITAANGGIVESNDSLMYLAPDTGYKSGIEVAGERKWIVERRFYLKTRDGKLFANVFASVSALTSDDLAPADPEEAKNYTPPGEIQLHCVLNPSGSRSLEPDPKKVYKSYADYLKAEPKREERGTGALIDDRNRLW